VSAPTKTIDSFSLESFCFSEKGFRRARLCNEHFLQQTILAIALVLYNEKSSATGPLSIVAKRGMVMNFQRILTLATNVFAETIRDRVLYLIGLYAIALLAGAQMLPQLAAGTGDKILLDFGLNIMSFLGLIITIFVGTNLINKEVDKKTMLVLISKPIARWELIVGKHWGLSFVLAILVFAMTIIYLLVLWLKQVPFELGSLLLASLFLFLQLALITAVAIFFGVFTSSLLATLLTFAIYLMGHFTRDLLEFGEISESPGLQNLAQGLYLILPDLARLDLKNQAVYGIEALPQASTLATNVAYGIVYVILLLAIASWIFARREF
jgi:ABC-type transport system involved in multi-copper enzyme maturation permease subunit